MHVLAVAALAFSTLVVPPDPVPAELVGVGGTGCPQGGFTLTTTPDNSSMTLRSNGDGWMEAKSGKGTTLRDERRWCQAIIRIRPPEGWTYALGDSEYFGFADLQRGATGTVLTQVYFQGMAGTRSRMATVRGPYNDNWQSADRVDVAARIYSPCGDDRNVNVQFEVRAAKGTSDPETTNYMWRDLAETTYGLHWKKCP